MQNKKGKKKEIVVLILLLLVLCSGVVSGVVLFNQKNNNKVSNEDTDTKKPVNKTEVAKEVSNQHTVIVKSDTGVVLPNVLVSIYDADGNMLTVPEATDAVGRLIYTPEKEGTYGASVLAAPHQYALDREIYYFKTGEKLLSIVLKEDPNAYVAKIGDMNYTLRDAITAANAATEDVTITLLHDVYIVSDTYINNKSGKTITIDGAGHTVTYLANSTLFSISQKAGTVHFKNMTISHNGEGAAFRTSNAINLNLTDVTILAQNDTEGFYKWSLINLFGKGKTNLTMTRVKIDMDITTIEKDAAGASVIRTGNEGSVKDIKITMNDCYIDATGAVGRAGIRVTPDTTADVVLNNTIILTQNNYVIAVDGQLTWSKTNSTLGSKDKYYNDHPVPDVIATVGNTKFYSLNTAAKQASKLGGKESVKLVGDITLFNSTTFSGDGITAIIDGNGHTITTEGGNTIFKINANNYKLTFRNMKIKHGGYERLLQYEAKKEGIDVTWENVTVVASGTTEDACYKYGLMNLRGSGSFTMKSSSITLDVPKIINGSAPGVIRTGNANDGQKLTICLNDSKIDASKTNGAYGIYVQKSAVTDIVLKNYEIHTNNRYPVYVHADDGDATLTYDNMNTWSCKNGSVNFLCNLTSLMNMADAAKIGNTVYKTLPEAFKAAQEAGGDVTITLLRDCQLLARTDFKTEHSSITIDGDGQYSLSTAGSALIFVLDNDNVALTFKNLKIDHKGYDRLVTFNKKSEGVYTGVNVVFDNVTMTASGTNADKCYPYGVFNLRASGAFTMIDSTITVESEKVFGGDGYSVIRLGNANDGQTVNITMNNSTIDASKTENIAGVNVSNGATAKIKTSNSAIKTKNKHAIHVNSTGKLNLVPENTEWSYGDAITNCAARIGDDYYTGLIGAWNVARASETPTTITLLKNCTVSSKFDTLSQTGANITIDGDNKKYTLTATANDVNIFTFGGNNLSLTFKDLVIEHKGNDRFVTCNKTNTVTYSGINLVLDNVTMTASGTTTDKCYQYGVFNIRANGNVELIDSTITLDVQTTTGGADCGVIRLGNSGDGTSVDVTMTNSTIDASNTKKISGIYVNGGVTADVALTDSTIKTKERYAINVNATGTLTLNESNAQWSCTDQSAGINSITNLAAKIGKDCYKTFEDAWNAALAKNTATTITLLNDVTVTTQLPTISKDGTDLTIDGQNKKYTLTAALTVDDKNVIDIGLGGTEKKANLTLQNMKITHKTQRALVGVGKNAKSSAQLNVNNVEITVDYTDTSYYLQYGVFNMRGSATLIMTDVTTTVASSETGTDRGIIRIGNNDDGATVYARLQNCTLDTKQATDVAIARVNRGNTLDISCQNCDLETGNAYVFNINSTGGTFTACVDKYTEANSVAGGKTQLYNEGVQYEAVENLTQASAGASINGFLYTDAKAAFDDAQLLDGYVTIKLLKDNSWPTPANVSMNTQYVDLTIDGQGQYKLTTGTTNKECSAFYIEKDNISLTLKDMDIHHISKRAIVAVKQRKNADGEAIGTGINVSLKNVEVTTEAFDGTTKHDSGLINIRNNASLYMKDVKIDYKNSVPTGRSTSYQVIRFGNKSSDDGTKTVTAVLENCEVNVNDGHSTAFFAHTGTTVILTAKNCKFKNFKQNLVYRAEDSNLTFTWDNSTWNGKTGTKSELVHYTTCKEGYNCTITGASD